MKGVEIKKIKEGGSSSKTLKGVEIKKIKEGGGSSTNSGFCNNTGAATQKGCLINRIQHITHEE